MATNWAGLYASRTGGMRSSMVRELLKLTEQPDIISFAGGLPAPEMFPRRRVQEATQHVLQHGCEALQYGATEGYRPLREMIFRHISRYGIECTLDNVLITTGSQQALDLMGKIFLNPGDKVIVEEPTYLGAIQAWRAYQGEFLTVQTDDDGMLPESLEAALKTGEAKFIYALPNFQNPSGRTMTLERRKEIVRLADQYGVPILEDDPYGQLRYEGEHLPPLIVIDAQSRPNGHEDALASGNVVYLSTFSKTLCPGFRVAWMVGPGEVIGKMVQGKQGSDLHTSTFSQIIAYETARHGFLDEHVRELRRVYGERRDLMLRLMAEHFPPGVTWTHPEGGLFLWVTLPEGLNSVELLEKAVEHKVAYVPGVAFYPYQGGENMMRINFSNASPEQITVGIKRLAAVFAEAIEAQPA